MVCGFNKGFVVGIMYKGIVPLVDVYSWLHCFLVSLEIREQLQGVGGQGDTTADFDPNSNVHV